MGRALFGTDGVRGVANRQLTPELALRLGEAVVRVARGAQGVAAPRVVIGRDTRRSGPMLEAALAAGIAAAGGEALRAGVLPTPGVALLVRRGLGDVGAVISASHNPFADNGIKFFGGDGYKLTDAEEERIEELLEEPWERPTGAGVGDVSDLAGAAQAYGDWIAHQVDVDLSELRVAVDLGHGAACAVAPGVFQRLGLRADLTGDAPDGRNINVGCGSTHLDHVASVVRAGGYDLGLAFDGDADRMLAVDHAGEPVDGDHILGILARDMLEQGRLANDLVVITSMANLGLRRALDGLGARTVVTDVGDRYVLEAMRRDGGVLGGEQSGHVIVLDRHTTGDGLLAAVLLLQAVARRRAPLADTAALVRKYPQRLVSVTADRARLAGCAPVWDAVRAAEAELGDDGRVNVRASGTEPLVRVMVEAPTAETVERLLGSIRGVVERELGVPAERH